MGGSGVVHDVDAAKKVEADQKQKIMTKLVQMRHNLGVAIDKLQDGSVAELQHFLKNEMDISVGDSLIITDNLFDITTT